MSIEVTDRDLVPAGMLPTPGLARASGRVKDVPPLNSKMSPPPPPPFWAGWTLDLTFHGGTTQQKDWFNEAVQECTFPVQSLGVKIDVYFTGRPPKSDTRHPYMVSQMDRANHVNIYVEPWADDATAPENAGLPNVANNIKEYYKESVVHELGHVVTWSKIGSASQDAATRQARQAAYCALFEHTVPPIRQGTLGDWSDVNLPWAEEIQEAAAEVFKCSFYAERLKLLYKNRTNWTISHRNWQQLMVLMQPGQFAVADTTNAYGSFADLGSDSVAGPTTPVGSVFQQWFSGGSSFVTEQGNVYFDPSLFGGENLQRFSSTSPFIDPPPPPPPNTLGHGWAGPPDFSPTWAYAFMNSLYFAPPRQSLSRKGIVKLTILEQSKSQSSLSISIIDETGQTWGGVTYNYAFTPPGYDTLTAYAVVLGHQFPPNIRGVPLNPPCKLFIEVDADEGTASAGVMDMADNIVTAFSITNLPKTHLYLPVFQPSGNWNMIGDDPLYKGSPGNEYSVMRIGECTWTTQPTPVEGPFPFKPPGVIPSAQQHGLVSLD